jgi:hypothetical protein
MSIGSAPFGVLPFGGQVVAGGGGGGTTVGTFDSTSSSTTSFTGSLSLSGAFASVSASTVSFNGSIDNGATFSSTTASAFSANGTLTLNGSFRSRSNLLSYSEEFDNSDWVKVRVDVVENQAIAPDGTLSADKIISTGISDPLFYQITDLSITSGNVFTFSIDLWTDAGQPTGMQLYIFGSNYPNDGMIIGKNITLTTSPVRHSISITAPVGVTSTDIRSRIDLKQNPDDGDYIYAWRAQTQRGAIATAYDKTPATTSSFNGSLTSYGSFSSVAASATSFNGSIVNQFSSIASSTASFSGTLTLNALFSTTTASAASFNGSLAGTNAGVFSGEATTSASFNGSLFSYSSLSSVSTSAFSASGSIDSSAEFNSASVSSLSLSGRIEQFGTFASVSTSSFNIFNEEPPTPSKRVISSSASNRTISSTSNRVITTH